VARVRDREIMYRMGGRRMVSAEKIRRRGGRGYAREMGVLVLLGEDLEGWWWL
jgi:hypothetical protein